MLEWSSIWDLSDFAHQPSPPVKEQICLEDAFCVFKMVVFIVRGCAAAKYDQDNKRLNGKPLTYTPILRIYSHDV